MLFLRPCSCETASQKWGRNTWWLKAGISSPAEYHSHDPGQAGLDISSRRKFEHIYEMITACYSIYISEPCFLEFTGKLLPCFFLVPRTELNILHGLISAEKEKNNICFFWIFRFAVLSHSVMFDSVLCQAPLSMDVLQARILMWVAMPSSRGSSQPRDWTQVSCIAGGFFIIWATREAWIFHFKSGLSWTHWLI